MTTTDSTGEILDIDGVCELAPDMSVADAFRLAFKDEACELRWRAADVRDYIAGSNR